MGCHCLIKMSNVGSLPFLASAKRWCTSTSQGLPGLFAVYNVPATDLHPPKVLRNLACHLEGVRVALTWLASLPSIYPDSHRFLWGAVMKWFGWKYMTLDRTPVWWVLHTLTLGVVTLKPLSEAKGTTSEKSIVRLNEEDMQCHHDHCPSTTTFSTSALKV